MAVALIVDHRMTARNGIRLRSTNDPIRVRGVCEDFIMASRTAVGWRPVTSPPTIAALARHDERKSRATRPVELFRSRRGRHLLVNSPMRDEAGVHDSSCSRGPV